MGARAVACGPRRSQASRAWRHAGFSYVGLLILIALMGVGLAATGTLASAERRRAQETELLFIGEQYRRAIERYYQNGPAGQKQYPPNLEALLRDPRHPGVRRYLRRAYVDPITGRAEWGVVEGPGGTVAGVHSLSMSAPLKTGNFLQTHASFEGKGAYAEWKFVYVPPVLAPGAVRPATPAALPR